MSLIKDSFKKQINTNNNIQFSETTGTILEYDRTTETCKIKFLNPSGFGYIYRGNVKVSNTAGGLASGSIFPGQKCSISFINKNIYAPVITGIHDSYYSERSCTDQGAYLPDDEIYKTGTPEHIIALNLDWINNENEGLNKYQNSNARYADVDVNEKSLDLITTLDKYGDREVGLTHLENKSTIKLRDNGDIDIFTEANTGIRICKNGNIKFYGTDIEYTDTKSEKTDVSISTPLSVAQIMKICLAYDIIKEIDTYVTYIEEDGASIVANTGSTKAKSKNTKGKAISEGVIEEVKLQQDQSNSGTVTDKLTGK